VDKLGQIIKWLGEDQNEVIQAAYKITHTINMYIIIISVEITRTTCEITLPVLYQLWDLHQSILLCNHLYPWTSIYIIHTYICIYTNCKYFTVFFTYLFSHAGHHLVDEKLNIFVGSVNQTHEGVSSVDCMLVTLHLTQSANHSIKL